MRGCSKSPVLMVPLTFAAFLTQYDPAATKVDPPQPFSQQDSSRDNWKPSEPGPFVEPAGSLNRLLEMVVAAVVAN